MISRPAGPPQGCHRQLRRWEAAVVVARLVVWYCPQPRDLDSAWRDLTNGYIYISHSARAQPGLSSPHRSCLSESALPTSVCMWSAVIIPEHATQPIEHGGYTSQQSARASSSSSSTDQTKDQERGYTMFVCSNRRGILLDAHLIFLPAALIRFKYQ